MKDLYDLFEGLTEELLGGGKSKPKTPETQHALTGDPIRLEQITQGDTFYMKVHLPNRQAVKIPDGTTGKRYRYQSPNDGAKRIIIGAYVAGRCKIVHGDSIIDESF